MRSESLRVFLLAFAFFGLLLAALPELPQRILTLWEGNAPREVASDPSLSRSRTSSEIAPAMFSEVAHAPAVAAGTSADSFSSPAAIAQVERQLVSSGAREIQVTQREGAYEAHCLVPLAQGSPYEKPFSVYGANPVQALAGLLEQIQQWQSRPSSR
jgi:hypothetical protein